MEVLVEVISSILYIIVTISMARKSSYIPLSMQQPEL